MTAKITVESMKKENQKLSQTLLNTLAKVELFQKDAKHSWDLVIQGNACARIEKARHQTIKAVAITFGIICLIEMGLGTAIIYNQLSQIEGLKLDAAEVRDAYARVAADDLLWQKREARWKDRAKEAEKAVKACIEHYHPKP